MQQNNIKNLIQAIDNYQDLLKLKDGIEQKIKENKKAIENKNSYLLSSKIKEQESILSKLSEEIEGWRQISFEVVSALPVGKVSEDLTIEDNLVAESANGNVRERVAIYNGGAIAKFTYLQAGAAKKSTSYHGAN